MLPLDLRMDDSVREGVEAVSCQAGRLDVLINNARYELAGALEELSSEEARASSNQFLRRRQDGQCGTSVDASAEGWADYQRWFALRSIADSVPGRYSATKFALKGTRGRPADSRC